MSFTFNFVDNPRDLHMHHPGRPKPLNEPIHPIWRRSAFVDLEFADLVDPGEWSKPDNILAEAVYTRMEPGLRLASIFLKRHRGFFLKVLFADLDPILMPDGSVESVLSESYVPGTADHVQLSQTFASLAEGYRIFSADRALANPPNQDWLGRTNIWQSYKELGPAVLFLQSCLAREILDEFKDPRWNRRLVSDRQAVLIHLAFTLVHELAHAIWCVRMSPETRREHRKSGRVFHFPEPKFRAEDREFELGVQLEMEIAGCSIQFPCVPHISPERNYLNGRLFNGRGGLEGWSTDAPVGQNIGWAVTNRTLDWMLDRRSWTLDANGEYPPLQMWFYQIDTTYAFIKPPPRGIYRY